LILTLDRGGKGNALSPELVEDLHHAIGEAEDSAVHTLVLRAEGAGFCGGLDLVGLETETDGSLLLRLVRIELLLQRLFRLPCRTIAMAHSFAYGAGADLFAAAQIRIATPDLRLSFPGVKFGIALGTKRLALRMGPDAALEALNAEGPMDAEHAHRYGLATKIASRETWPSMIERFIDAPPIVDRDVGLHALPRLMAADDEADLAALVRSAARPGLKERIMCYVATIRRKK